MIIAHCSPHGEVAFSDTLPPGHLLIWAGEDEDKLRQVVTNQAALWSGPGLRVPTCQGLSLHDRVSHLRQQVKRRMY